MKCLAHIMRSLRFSGLCCVVTFLSLGWNAGSGAVFAQGIATEAPVPVVPLVGPNPGQKVLVIAEKNETDVMRQILTPLGMTADFLGNFDKRRRDYRGYHAIVVCTNRMDYYSSLENQAPAVFQPIVDFVAGGGHLIMFGTYHGRNMEHLLRFDIKAFGGANSRFSRIPGATDALISGVESIVPESNELSFLGNIRITRYHVPLLMRGAGGSEPALATTSFGNGRVSIIMVEPNFRKEYWLMQVMMSWHHRGAPTRLVSAGMQGISALESSTARRPVPPAAAVESATAVIHQAYEDEYKQLGPRSSMLARELAGKLLVLALQETDPVRCYALLSEVREVSEKGGDAATALNAIEITARTFRAPALSASLESLPKSAAAGRTPADFRTVTEVALMGANEAMTVQRYDDADSFLAIADTNGRRAKIPGLPKFVSDLKQQISDARKAAGGK